MSTSLPARLTLVARLLRAEGPRALVDRFRDRQLDAQRARRFTLTGAAAAGRSDPEAVPPVPDDARSATLWVLPFPLQRRSGGAAIQLLVNLEERASAGPVALLQRLPGRLRCELWGRGVSPPLAREWPVPRPEGLLPVLLQAAHWVGARRLHFESLVDLPADLPLAVRASGLGFGISAHDFALFCPRPHLVEVPSGRFCDFSTDPERCARCLGASWTLAAGFQERRRALMAEVVAAADSLEFPSGYMLREHQRLFPALDPARARVLPPRSLAEPLRGALRRPCRPPARLAFAGAVHRHKGALEFEAVVRQLAEERPGAFEWHVFGGGDAALLFRLRRLPRTRIHGYYRAGALPARLQAAKIDLVVLPSIWPEAHCLVLDECAAAGVPVVAFDLGAPADRIRAGGLGELVDPSSGAAGLAACIAALG